MSIKITYKDIDPTAKSDSTVTTTNKQSFVNLNELKEDEGVRVNKYATLEDNYWILDESFLEFPDVIGNNKMGYVSSSMSDEDGDFSTPVVLTRTFTQNHTSVGVTFEFSQYGDYCPLLNIKWYRDSELLADEDYTANSNICFCQKNVRIFNKMVITFYKTSIPRRYIRIQKIDDGIIRTFNETELKNILITEDIVEDSSSLPINTLKFELSNQTSTDYIFQRSQPFEVKYNENLLGLYYISNAVRKSKKEFEIEAVDYIGLLDKTYFVGGIYNNSSVETILNSLFADEKITYTISQSLRAKTLSGYLPYTTKREALKQIAFAICGIVDSSRDDTIRIYELSDVVESEIDESKVFVGGHIETGDKITGVSVVEHNYVTTQNTVELFNGSISGNTVIVFDEPIHSLTISNGTIVGSGANYAIINGNGVVTLSGKTYQDMQRVIEKNNPLITSLDIPNVKSFNNYTLVTSLNSQEVVNNVYDACIKNISINADFILSTEKVGDEVSILTEFEGEKEGRLVSLDMKLKNSNIVAKGVIVSGGADI